MTSNEQQKSSRLADYVAEKQGLIDSLAATRDELQQQIEEARGAILKRLIGGPARLVGQPAPGQTLPVPPEPPRRLLVTVQQYRGGYVVRVPWPSGDATVISMKYSLVGWVDRLRGTVEVVNPQWEEWCQLWGAS